MRMSMIKWRWLVRFVRIVIAADQDRHRDEPGAITVHDLLLTLVQLFSGQVLR
jgi:hypothetical protein